MLASAPGWHERRAAPSPLPRTRQGPLHEALPIPGRSARSHLLGQAPRLAHHQRHIFHILERRHRHVAWQPQQQRGLRVHARDGSRQRHERAGQGVAAGLYRAVRGLAPSGVPSDARADAWVMFERMSTPMTGVCPGNAVRTGCSTMPGSAGSASHTLASSATTRCLASDLCAAGSPHPKPATPCPHPRPQRPCPRPTRPPCPRTCFLLQPRRMAGSKECVSMHPCGVGYQ